MKFTAEQFELKMKSGFKVGDVVVVARQLDEFADPNQWQPIVCKVTDRDLSGKMLVLQNLDGQRSFSGVCHAHRCEHILT